MRYKGAKIVVLCCFLLHIFFSMDFFLIQVLPQKGTAFGSVAQGVVYLFYPLVGLLADVCFTRYKVILASALLRLIVATFGTGLLLAWTLGILVDFHFVDRVYTHNFVHLGNGLHSCYDSFNWDVRGQCYSVWHGPDAGGIF